MNNPAAPSNFYLVERVLEIVVGGGAAFDLKMLFCVGDIKQASDYTYLSMLSSEAKFHP